MEFDVFRQNLERLQKRLNLPNTLRISDSLTVSLVINEEVPLSLNIRYDRDDGQIWIDSPIAYNLPSSSEGLQELMIKLFNDLIVREKKIGRLIAAPDGSNLMFVKSLKPDPSNLDLLADFVPQFIEEALSWRKKLQAVLNENETGTVKAPKEILSFNYDLS